MCKGTPKILNHRIRKERITKCFYTSGYTAMKKETSVWYTFLMMRNLSDFSFCCCLAFTDLWEKFDCFCFIFGRDLETVYCFMEGCFFSMANCVSHTCFISFFTSSTSALYTLLVAFMRFAIWFRLQPIFRVWHCIPEAQNSQCHRHSCTKSGAAGKRICLSCWRLCISAPVCKVHHRLGGV